MKRLIVGVVIALQAQVAVAKMIKPMTRVPPDPEGVAELETALDKRGGPSALLPYLVISVDVGAPDVRTERVPRKRAIPLAEAWARRLADRKRGNMSCESMPLRRGVACILVPKDIVSDGRSGGTTKEEILFLHFCRNVNLRLAHVTTTHKLEDVGRLLASKDDMCGP